MNNDEPLKKEDVHVEYARAVPVNSYGQPLNEQQQQQQQEHQQPYIGQQQPYIGQPPPQQPFNGQPVMFVQPVPVSSNSAIRHDAQGNALCKKCNTPYPLPPGCTSWR